jgi:hypothetical protein
VHAVLDGDRFTFPPQCEASTPIAAVLGLIELSLSVITTTAGSASLAGGPSS